MDKATAENINRHLTNGTPAAKLGPMAKRIKELTSFRNSAVNAEHFERYETVAQLEAKREYFRSLAAKRRKEAAGIPANQKSHRLALMMAGQSDECVEYLDYLIALKGD